MKMSNMTINFVASGFMGLDWIRRQATGLYSPLKHCIVPDLKEQVQAHKWYWDSNDEQYVGIILRHDQVSEIQKSITNEMNNEYIKTELIHTSPDFTNLNYVGDDNGMGNNYLNFYIYKVTYNV